MIFISTRQLFGMAFVFAVTYRWSIYHQDVPVVRFSIYDMRSLIKWEVSFHYATIKSETLQQTSFQYFFSWYAITTTFKTTCKWNLSLQYPKCYKIFKARSISARMLVWWTIRVLQLYLNPLAKYYKSQEK